MSNLKGVGWCIKEGGGIRTPYQLLGNGLSGKNQHFTSSKNKAKEIGCKKITKIKRHIGYRRKDVV